MATCLWRGNDSSNPGDYSVAGNWSGAVPVADDTVIIPAGSGNITAGLNQASIELEEFTVQEGYTGRIGIRPTSGAAPTYLQLGIMTNSPCELTLSNYAYIDVDNSDIDVTVFRAAQGTSGDYGLCLLGSAIQTLSVHQGSVGLGYQRGNLADCDDIQLRAGALLYRGAGSGSSAATIMGGTLIDAGGISQCDIYSGVLKAVENCPFTTLICYGRRTILNNDAGTGGTTVNLKGANATLDLSQSGIPRTIVTLNYDEGRLIKTPATTITNFNVSSLAFDMSCATLR